MKIPFIDKYKSPGGKLEGQFLSNMLGIHVEKGYDLVSKDYRSPSDPYVVVKMGKQKEKTQVVYDNNDPEWNEDLILSISEPLPVELSVWDKDKWTRDDAMGNATIDIQPFLQAKASKRPANDVVVKKIQPNSQNCLAEESQIKWENGKLVQTMTLKLRNVKSGKVVIELYQTKSE